MKLLTEHEERYMLENRISGGRIRAGIFSDDGSIVVELDIGDRRNVYDYLVEPDDMHSKVGRTLAWWE